MAEPLAVLQLTTTTNGNLALTVSLPVGSNCLAVIGCAHAILAHLTSAVTYVEIKPPPNPAGDIPPTEVKH